MATTPPETALDTDVFAAIATERRRLADELEALTDEQWQTPSQCAEWTVGELASHLIIPFETSLPRFAFTAAKHRGNIDRMAIELTARVHQRNTRRQVIDKLRANADSEWTPPRFGVEIPLSEIVVHGEDIRRPLGLASTVPADVVDLALELITDPEIRADYAARVGR